MEKIFNYISVITGTLGGLIVSILGGWDKLLMALLILMILDYVTGLIKAFYNKELSSEIGFKGLIKKVLILIVVAVSVVSQNMLGITAIREIVIMFFASNEALSILENAGAMGLPLPQKLEKALVQIRDKEENNDEE